MAEDTTWVFDSLVCFLHGPIWNAPLQTFVEEKSLSMKRKKMFYYKMENAKKKFLFAVFDPNEKSTDINPEYVKVHEEYKNLVIEKIVSF